MGPPGWVWQAEAWHWEEWRWGIHPGRFVERDDIPPLPGVAVLPPPQPSLLLPPGTAIAAAGVASPQPQPQAQPQAQPQMPPQQAKPQMPPQQAKPPTPQMPPQEDQQVWQ